MALGSRSLIGEVHLCLDFLVLPLITDLCESPGVSFDPNFEADPAVATRRAPDAQDDPKTVKQRFPATFFSG